MDFKAYKMDGLGNDFVIIDQREKKFDLNNSQIKKNCEISDYKYLNINDEIKDPYLYNNYESEYYYCKLYNNNLNNIILSELHYNHDLIANNLNINFSTIYSIYDLVIKEFD